MYQTLKKCMAPIAPVGREQAMAECILAEIAPYTDSCTVNALGTVIAVKYGTGAEGEKKKILFSASLGQGGMMVSRIEDSGRLRVISLGEVNGNSLAYQEVVFANKTKGVMLPEGGYDVSTQMQCDIGAASKKEAEHKVKIGDYLVPASRLTRLSGSRITGSPLGDRLGAALLLLAAKDLTESPVANDVYFVFTTPEGAAAAAYSIQPDYGFAVDCCKGDDGGAEMGGGAVIGIKGLRFVCDTEVVRHMQKTASDAGIPVQYAAPCSGGNDAAPVQKTGTGVRIGLLAVPLCHRNTAAEIADLRDAKACRRLISALCQTL